MLFLCFAWCHHVMTQRHDVTKLIFPISVCQCSKMVIQIHFCKYFGCWVPNYYRLCICMICFLVITWRHDVTEFILHYVKKLISVILACKCVRELIPFSVISLVAELNFVIVIIFAWWNNVTKWRHDVIKHAVPISACSSARDMIFFVSIVFWVAVQKYHRFYIYICGYVITWRH